MFIVNGVSGALLHCINFGAATEQSCGALTDFDELTVRQLVSNIKVLDKDSLLICFKDGTEITQAMQRRQTA